MLDGVDDVDGIQRRNRLQHTLDAAHHLLNNRLDGDAVTAADPDRRPHREDDQGPNGGDQCRNQRRCDGKRPLHDVLNRLRNAGDELQPPQDDAALEGVDGAVDISGGQLRADRLQRAGKCGTDGAEPAGDVADQLLRLLKGVQLIHHDLPEERIDTGCGDVGGVAEQLLDRGDDRGEYLERVVQGGQLNRRHMHLGQRRRM
ncbi:hypothetical protein C1S80_05170 [Mycolicibacterium aubagnense]|nr:hypothetical protein C1S80_05170 [Mycolicibacterium aubagnense]